MLLPILAVGQTTVAIHFEWAGGRSNLLLVTVLAWNLVSRDVGGLLWAFVGGLSLDALSGGPLGASVLALLFVSFIGYIIGGHIWATHWVLPLMAVTLASLIYHLVYLCVLTISGWPVNWVTAITNTTLPSAALNFLLMIPVYPGMRWVAKRIYYPRVGI